MRSQFFPQELALAKPVAHDEFVLEPFFNKLLTQRIWIAPVGHFSREPSGMPVKVEFFGIPRARAGVADTTVEGGTVGNVLEELARRFPRLAQTCIADGKLQAGYTLNLRGQRFVREPETTLSEGDVLLFLSLDAGG